MNWKEGSRRVLVAFGTIYWAVAAFSAYGAAMNGGRDGRLADPHEHHVEGRCYSMHRPFGRIDEGQRIAEAMDRKRGSRPEVIVVPGPPGQPEIRLPVCYDLPDRFWWSEAYSRAAKDVLGPALVFWVILCCLYGGLTWIISGFRAGRR